MSLISFDAVMEDSIPATLLLDTGAEGTLHLSRSFHCGQGRTLHGRPVPHRSGRGCRRPGNCQA
ncbi:MAG: hypothetical protein MZU79_01895 [Anaerotruncus sp.]|nr:hypothetical protein [Anaerotruncus sp.]